MRLPEPDGMLTPSVTRGQEAPTQRAEWMLPASLFGGEREASPEVPMDDSQPPNDRHRRQSVPGRARKRAIRLHAACTGVSYTIAARRLAAGTINADQGRTLYPADATRSRRTLAERIADARLAADLPHGRAAHLIERFPPRDGGPGVGTLYGGSARQDVLGQAYTLVVDERPDLEPSAIDLAWQAESGEETVLDTACAQLDRAVRLLLDEGWERIASALPLSPQLLDVRIDGARQIMDALLVVSEDGHVPGTRVVMLSGRPATIVGAKWALTGPPIAYAVRPHGLAGEAPAVDVLVPPHELLVLAGQGTE
ncbi:MAG: hypothetical protein HOV77_19395 [Hamadaea sp.]|uniref:hypothetical protein n=1 Tax=Hamadaea sp. TaxID=2024425 RepID=UPI0018124F71|nr:hypothetical protein [Hamadaea sp.]NUT21344.1 hypothetical protein [Hamadaea sp.]